MTSAIFIVVPEESDPDSRMLNCAAKILVEALGLPQVRVVSTDLLPQSFSAALDFRTEGGTQEGELHAGDACRIWRLADGAVKLPGKIRVQGTGGWQELPGGHEHHWVPSPCFSGSAPEYLANVSLYYSLKRLRKLGIATIESLVDWLILANLLGECDAGMHVRDLLKAKKGHFPDTSNMNEAQLEEFASDYEYAIGLLARRIKRDSHIAVLELLRTPAIALIESVSMEDGDRSEFELLLTQAVNRATKAYQLATLGIAANFAGLRNVFQKAGNRLMGEYLDEKQAYVRSALSLQSYCYEPCLATFLLLLVREERPQFIPELGRTESVQYRWSVFPGKYGDKLKVDAVPRSVSLIDSGSKLISRSLLKNWMCLLFPPDPPKEMQIELEKINYSATIGPIEDIWLEVFQEIFRDAGVPMLKVHPWPYPNRAALSLRYDVDRAFTSEQLERILYIQRRRLKADCATWYLFPPLADENTTKGNIESEGQEIGIHELNAQGSARDGYGVTFHSGPTSEYWRGLYSINQLVRSNVSYGELLSAQCGIPHRLFLQDFQECPEKFWVLPIHFPLEAGTKNDGLSYFDQLLNEFRTLRRAGGHLILCSHPDVDQSHLESLLDREGVEDLWCETIMGVVTRCEITLGYGAIRVCDGAEDQLTIIAHNTVNDLRLTIYPSGEQPYDSVVNQLVAGVPQVISLKR